MSTDQKERIRQLETQLQQLEAQLQRSNIVEIGLSDIERNPENPRQRFEKKYIDELAASIAVHGQLEACIVEPIEKSRYMLLAGESRFRACEQLAHQWKYQEPPKAPPKLRAVVEAELTKAKRATIMALGNMQRMNLGTMEVAAAMRLLELSSPDSTRKSLAEKFNKKGGGSITTQTELLGLPRAVQTLIHAHKVGFGKARELVSLRSRGQLPMYALFLQDFHASARRWNAKERWKSNIERLLRESKCHPDGPDAEDDRTFWWDGQKVELDKSHATLLRCLCPDAACAKRLLDRPVRREITSIANEVFPQAKDPGGHIKKRTGELGTSLVAFGFSIRIEKGNVVLECTKKRRSRQTAGDESLQTPWKDCHICTEHPFRFKSPDGPPTSRSRVETIARDARASH